MNAPEIIEDGLALLRKPFPENQIGKLCRSTKKENPKGRCNVCGGYHGLPAITFDYVGHAAITDRLLDCDPGWTWEPLAIDASGLPVIDQEGGLWIKLTVRGVTRLGYGDAQGKFGGDAMKERIGDAIRNAAMRFGAALDLWHKGELHVETTPDAFQSLPEETQDWMLTCAMEIAVAIQQGDVEAAQDVLTGMDLDADAHAAFWGRLDSKQRSTLKAYKEIVKADTIEKLKTAWDAAPKHAHGALTKYKDTKKQALQDGISAQA